ncbi:carbohydrate esterase family 3 protein [Pleomassaria siparia CBS 279.74]|uniref:Carbohydrate esterase family 3 protein n=1 Tax=Pleomassaria siparia CBS 279.74 TaxID=1314801 RepID=A0A6G1KJX0_9PLEO|nr:carbohydrate esterase family 3 protein [Pleomassaria siparia CBS 279.74]
MNVPKCALFINVLAAPHGNPNIPLYHEPIFNSVNETFSDVGLNRRQDKTLLRLMPLGASITEGFDHNIAQNVRNGYRKPLREQLRYWGYPVNMVGSKSNGDFADDQNEGWPGLQIDDVAQKMMSVLTRQKPNLILILLGSNDAFKALADNNMAFAVSSKDRMRTLINTIVTESPGVTIMLATLPPTLTPANEPYIQTVNTGFRDLVTELASSGTKIMSVEMYSTWFTAEDHSDPIHFTVSGYTKMAAIWADAFKILETKGWLSTPIDTGDGDTVGCYPSPDTSMPYVLENLANYISSLKVTGPVQTQVGSGVDDGSYAHTSVEENSKQYTYQGLAPASLLGHFHFANLVKHSSEDQPLDELIRVLDPGDRKLNQLPYLSYLTNTGDGVFGKQWTSIDIGPECLSRGVRWGDVNGDGLDDFICVNQDGIPFVSLNRGGTPPKFEFIGAIWSTKTSQARVRLADVDGDGRVDYCTVENNNDLYCWRNGGSGDAPIAKYGGYWQGIVLVGGGGPTYDMTSKLGLSDGVDIEGTRLVDMNGDGRADYFFVSPSTSMKVIINQRGSNDDGKGLKPHWATTARDPEGWASLGNVNRNMILTGRVFGSGRADIIRMEPTGQNGFDYFFHFHRNTGSGGTKLRGDGARYCDMYGKGYDDYLWVWGGGMIDIFHAAPSRMSFHADITFVRRNVQNPPQWSVKGRILETGVERKFVNFGDWDGDGLCDVLTVDRITGNTYFYRNTYKDNGAGSGGIPTFDAPVQVIKDDRCYQPILNGNLLDKAVHFGDLDGDGRVDYICMKPDGTSLGWLNKASGMQTIPATNANQIKVRDGFDRANYQWADVNGDGKVDLLWVDKHTGNVKAWINKGIQPAFTSGILWDMQPSIWMPGVERGANIHFPKLSTSGRADYLWVHPQTSAAWVYYNAGSCAGDNGPGPDDGAMTDPVLPTVPGDASVI